jgi:hypothetical protein
VAISKKYEELVRVWPWLEKALDEDVVSGAYHLEDIWDLMRKGSAQLWTAESSVVLTNIFTYPRKPPTLNIWAAGCEVGKLQDEVMPLIDEVEAWARIGGFTHLTSCGRRAWGRAHNNGAKELFTVFSKELV